MCLSFSYSRSGFSVQCVLHTFAQFDELIKIFYIFDINTLEFVMAPLCCVRTETRIVPIRVIFFNHRTTFFSFSLFSSIFWALTRSFCATSLFHSIDSLVFFWLILLSLTELRIFRPS